MSKEPRHESEQNESAKRRAILQAAGASISGGSLLPAMTGSAVAGHECDDWTCPITKHTDHYAEVMYDNMNDAVDRVQSGLDKLNYDYDCYYDQPYYNVNLVEDDCGITITGGGCGETEVYVNFGSDEDTYAIYWGNDDAESLVSVMRNRGVHFAIGVAAVFAFAGKAKPLVVAAAAEEAAIYTADTIERYNDGCGVVFDWTVTDYETGNPIDWHWKDDGDYAFGIRTQGDHDYEPSSEEEEELETA